MAKIEKKDKSWILKLLQEGNTPTFIAEEWEVDVSHVYRKLKSWGYDTNGKPLKKGELTERQQAVFDYMEMRQFNVTRQDVVEAMNTSFFTVDMILRIKKKRLATKADLNKSTMLNKVRVARHYLREGVKRSAALIHAGLTFYEYKHWSPIFNAEMKKAPQ